jgi:protoporphyrinogen oxidase
MENDHSIIIIGAGVAGLVAALELEKAGQSIKIIEATDSVGGRVKTDFIDGYQLDHGFQVLLTAYPEVERYLDMNALNLKRFRPGANIHSDNKTFPLVDPLREPSSLISAITTPAGSLLDKYKIWRLSERLKKMSVEKIFRSPSSSTIDFLRDEGFSDRIITNFFQPFFSGIFLENTLQTSCRLFQFIFKMFAEGHAAIPEKGMQAIPDQLYSKLEHTEIDFETKVLSVEADRILSDKRQYAYSALIIATEPSNIIKGYQSPAKDFSSTINLYYGAPGQIGERYISLVPGKDSIINNISNLSKVAPSYAPKDESLLSVSIVGTPQKPNDQLIKTVSRDLAKLFKLNQSELKFIKSYYIPKALPQVENPFMHLSKNQITYDRNIYLAGDYLLGGSLNGAMLSGRQSAKLVLENHGSN